MLKFFLFDSYTVYKEIYYVFLVHWYHQARILGQSLPLDLQNRILPIINKSKIKNIELSHALYRSNSRICSQSNDSLLNVKIISNTFYSQNNVAWRNKKCFAQPAFCQLHKLTCHVNYNSTFLQL